jgi:sigma-B regulation protein RsbU (phosphoserine phosphatase)
MTWHRGLTARLIAGILGGGLAVYAGILIHVERRVRTLLIEQARDEARRIHAGVADRLDASLRPAREVPERLARILANLPADSAAVDEILQAVLDNNPTLAGTAVVLDPVAGAAAGRPDDRAGGIAVRWSRQQASLVREDPRSAGAGAARGDPVAPDWYGRALAAGGPVWSGPARDPVTGDGILTRAAPIAAGRGAAAADISLAWLQDHVASIQVARTGFAFVVSKDGRILAHPDGAKVVGATLSEAARRIGDPSLIDAAERTQRGESGFVRAVSPRTGAPAWFYYGPLEAIDGAVAVVFPEDEVTGAAARLGRRMAILGFAGAVALAGVIVLVSVSITGPLRRLTGATREVAAGNLAAEVPPARWRDEVGRLTADFRTMQQSLVRYVDDQKRAAAAAERLESQLRIAREIQLGMLPPDLSALTRGTGFEVHAALESALRVGGDLYDVVRHGDDRLTVVVGDVSGKGIPASLFMAMSITLVRTAARGGESIAGILRRTNDDLAAGNPGNMFVTLVCLQVDGRTGEVTAANAGHLPAILVGDGAPRPVFPIGGMMVGSFPGFEVKCESLVLQPGQTLVLYSDGVTEAFDPEGGMFGEERLVAALADAPGKDAAETVKNVMAAVRRHAADATQSDDITILALRRQ